MIFYQKKAGLLRRLTSTLFVTAPVFSRGDITFETFDSALGLDILSTFLISRLQPASSTLLACSGHF